MVAPLDIDIDGLKFVSKKMSPLDVLKLDRILIGMAAPVLAGFGKNAQGKMTIDFGKSAPALAELLIQLPEPVFLDFVVKCLSRTVWIGPQGAIDLKTMDAVNAAFESGSVLNIYRLVYEVLRFNKFSFFGAVDFGAVMQKITGLQSPTPSADPSSDGSDSSEPSTPT